MTTSKFFRLKEVDLFRIVAKQNGLNLAKSSHLRIVKQLIAISVTVNMLLICFTLNAQTFNYVAVKQYNSHLEKYELVSVQKQYNVVEICEGAVIINNDTVCRSGSVLPCCIVKHEDWEITTYWWAKNCVVINKWHRLNPYKRSKTYYLNF